MEEEAKLPFDINDIYKGDGVTSCKWCGDTGYMHTFTFTGIIGEALCVCKIGQEILDKKLKGENNE